MAKAFSSTVGVMFPMFVFPPALARLFLAGGCLYLVAPMASWAALCWAFLMLGPSAVYSSSPSLSVTVKRFLWAGPDSPVNRYWCWILLYRASSLTKHIGVFSLVFAKVSGTDDSSSDCVCTVDESFRLLLLSEVLPVGPPPPPPPLPPVTTGRLPADGVLVVLLVLPIVVVAVEGEIPPDSCGTGSA